MSKRGYVCNRYPSLKIGKGGGNVIEFVDGYFETEDEGEQKILDKYGAGNGVVPADLLSPEGEPMADITRSELEELRARLAELEGKEGKSPEPESDQLELEDPPSGDPQAQADAKNDDDDPNKDDKPKRPAGPKSTAHLGAVGTANLPGR